MLEEALQHSSESLSTLPRTHVSRQCAQLDAVSAKEELFQRRDENCVSRAVVLTFQDAALRIREDVGKLIRPMAQKHMTFPSTQEYRAVHHERGDSDGIPLPERQRVASLGVFHDGDVVNERGRHCL